MTLTDLVALVAGFAFTLTLAATFNESYIARIKMSAPEVILLRVGEYVSRFNIALVAVVLARHVRTGATFRGLEWLIIINAMRSVHLRLMYADGMQWVARWLGWDKPDDALGLRRFDSHYRLWYTLGIVVLVAVVMALIGFRRKMPHWLRLPLLVMLPLSAFWGPASLFDGELRILTSGRWPHVSYVRLLMMAYLGLMQVPEHVLVCLPIAAMLFELTREHRLAWTWVERAGLGAALVTAIIDGIMTVTEANRNVPLITLRVAYLSIWAAWWLVAFAVARVAVRGLSGLWTSWVDPPSEGLIPGRRE
jgi:hypothetical protein